MMLLILHYNVIAMASSDWSMTPVHHPLYSVSGHPNTAHRANCQFVQTGTRGFPSPPAGAIAGRSVTISSSLLRSGDIKPVT